MSLFKETVTTTASHRQSVHKMSARSPKKLSASERKRFIDARNCTIKCQSIIRMVLEMRNSYLEVKKDNTACTEMSFG